MHKYDVVLDYDPEKSLQEAENKDKRYKDFFSNLKARIREEKVSNPQKYKADDFQFDAFLENTKQIIHESFCQNINTPGVIKAIDTAIKKTNSYLEGK